MADIDAPAEVHEGIEEWEGVDPSCIVHALKDLKDVTKLPDGKPFYKTYGKWNILSAEKKQKTMQHFRKLDEPVRRAVIVKAREDEKVNGEAEKATRANTNKHDKATPQ